MKFESGMVGFLIVVLAIGGSIFGTILLSAEETPHDVTKYRFETEVTGLFPVDTSPQFFDYDLSRNYTGYYTQDTIINGVKYFAGVSYNKTGVNNYPVKYRPTNTASGETLIKSALDEELTDRFAENNTAVTYYQREYGNTYSFVSQTHTKTISSLMNELNLSDYDVVIIKQNTSSDYDNRNLWSFFGTKEQFLTGGAIPGTQSGYHAAAYVKMDVYNTYPGDSFYNIICRAIKIDNITHMVSFYYDNTTDGNSQVYTANINSTVISYPTLGLTDGIPISYSAYDVEEIDYMDISRGVRVTG